MQIARAAAWREGPVALHARIAPRFARDALSVLGPGAQAPSPGWGVDLASDRAWIRTARWMSTFSGLAIAVVVIAVNLVGDGLRDALDPRRRNR